jgi:hypothetical protein
MIRHALLVSAFAAVPVACGTGSGGAADDIGEARAEITQVPSDVLCVQVVVTGSGHTTTEQFDVIPGASSVLNMKGLPLGSDTFNGSAFGTACSSVTGSSTPAWSGDSVTTALSPGVVAEVKLVLRRNGQASVSVDFQGDDGGGIACAPGLTACGGACVDTSRDSHNCGGCGHVCSGSETCGGGGTPGVCGCTDDGSACTGQVCGTAVNNCGQTVSCGSCGINQKCCIDSCVCANCACP